MGGKPISLLNKKMQKLREKNGYLSTSMFTKTELAQLIAPKKSDEKKKNECG